ncbi:MAG: DUF2946 family protein [Rugosibacter sp.]
MHLNRPLTEARAKHCTRLLFLLGCLAVFMHLWAGTRLMVMQPAKLTDQGAFFGEICTVLGGNPGINKSPLNKTSAGFQASSYATANPDANTPANHDNPSSGHDCCSLCGASSPILLTLVPAAVPPAPTFQLSRTTAPEAPAARPFAWIAPPSRAPPVV